MEYLIFYSELDDFVLHIQDLDDTNDPDADGETNE